MHKLVVERIFTAIGRLDVALVELFRYLDISGADIGFADNTIVATLNVANFNSLPSASELFGVRYKLCFHISLLFQPLHNRLGNLDGIVGDFFWVIILVCDFQGYLFCEVGGVGVPIAVREVNFHGDFD